MRALRRTRVAVFLAVRSLVRGNAGVSLMSIAMMTAVFISVMFLPSLIAGATDALNLQLVGTLTGDLSVTASSGVTISGATSYLGQIRATEGVVAATGIRRVGSQVSHGSDSVTGGVDAVDPASYAQVFTTPWHMIEGRWLSAGDKHSIVLGIGVAGAGQTKLRTYASSLKTVHVGDTVEVTLLDGQRHTFVVQGIYENSFPLSDLGAFTTVADADSLISTTNISDEIRKAFDALDRLTSALGTAADQSSSLAAGANGVASAAGSLASSARTVASSASSVDSAAGTLATNAGSIATSTAALTTAAQQLAGALARAKGDLAAPAVASAKQSATSAAAVAQSAASLASTCPASAPTYCAAVAGHASIARAAAAAAASSTAATRTLAAALSQASASATTLAAQLASLSKGTAAMADAATQLANGTTSLASGTKNLAVASDQVHESTLAVARSATDLSDALTTSVQNAEGPSRATREDTLAKLDSAATVPGKDSVTRIVISVAAGADASTVTSRLQPLRDDIQFQSPAQLAAAIQDQLDTFDLINSIMRILSLLVAAITVLIITFVDLTNRRRQIGIERAIGIRSAAIVGSYVLKSMVTALIGTILGWLIFRFVLMPLVLRHPFQFPTGPVALASVPGVTRANVVILLVVAAVAALLPAIRTVRMRILDAIWGN